MSAKPSLVIIVADSVRHDAFGYSGGRASTPVVDEIAAESTVFERTITAAPWTVPSIAAMLTGVFAHRLGLAQWEQPWPERFSGLFESAALAGLEVASFVFDPQFLFKRVPPARVAGSSQKTEGLLSWIRQNRDKPHLLFIHYWWTHIPYIDKPMSLRTWRRTTDQLLAVANKGERAGAGLENLYYRAVERFSEHWLSRVLDELNLETTWLVVTADHGESWGERRERGPIRDVFDLHGNHLFESVLRVPLIIRPPGGKNPQRFDQLVRTVDLAPTFTDILALPARPQDDPIDGISLRKSIEGGAPPENRSAISAMNCDCLRRPDLPGDPLDLWWAFALTTGQYKLIEYPRENRRLAFDLDADPTETRDISQNLPRALDPLWQQLETEIQRAAVGPSLPEETSLIRDRLRRLGDIT